MSHLPLWTGWICLVAGLNRDVLIGNLNFYHNQRGLRTYGYVIMTNHMHAILQQPEGSLAHTIRDFKKMTTHTMTDLVYNEPESRREWISHRFRWNAAHRANVTSHQVWIHGSHAEELWSRKFFEQKLRYIHMNLVRAGWVDQPEDWRYSNAADFVRPCPLVHLYSWI